jgi:phosphoglycerol transferase MdoB-like AlkP superfamily enzyme
LVNHPSGTERVIQKPYVVAYRSITDPDNVVIGSLMVGQDKNQLEKQIEQSVDLTFLTITILIVLSLLPISLISRVLSRSLKVWGAVTFGLVYFLSDHRPYSVHRI